MLSEELGGLSGGLQEANRKISPAPKNQFVAQPWSTKRPCNAAHRHLASLTAPRPYDSPRLRAPSDSARSGGLAAELHRFHCRRLFRTKTRTLREEPRAKPTARRRGHCLTPPPRADARNRALTAPPPAQAAGDKKSTEKTPWRRPPPPARAASAPSRT